MADTDSDSELSVLSSSLFTSPDALVSNRSSNASFTNSPSTQGELSRPNLVAIPPPNNRPEALEHIETLLESVIDNLINDEVLEISFRTTQSRVRSREVEGQVPVRFPGSTVQGRRFEALLFILEISHEALLSGHVITKRNLYYQNVDLFKSQTVVDEMVDSLALTLGIGREDLNIVAAAKGLIAGPIDLFMWGGGVTRCGLSSGNGMLLPSIRFVEKVDFGNARWLLVIEKEATFRTLAAAQYASSSSASPGILITAKGYPDLATRRFLHTLHSVRPQLKFFALVDFDPPGIAILRNYKYGSKRLKHEENSTVPSIRWLGIRSSDFAFQDFGSGLTDSHTQTHQSASQSTQETSSQESMYFSQDSQGELPHSGHRTPRAASTRGAQKTSRLSRADRKKAVDVMNDIYNGTYLDEDDREQLAELQRMLMMNVKEEMQAVDDCGDITEWLDEKLQFHMR